MPDGLQQCAEQDYHVVTVPCLELKHPAGGMNHLDAESIFRVTNVLLHPLKERFDLTQIVLRPDVPFEQNVDGFLPHVKVACAVANETFNPSHRFSRA
jgi:hypothetical protein